MLLREAWLSSQLCSPHAAQRFCSAKWQIAIVRSRTSEIQRTNLLFGDCRKEFSVFCVLPARESVPSVADMIVCCSLGSRCKPVFYVPLEFCVLDSACSSTAA